MDYTKIIKRAWQITWRHKALWLFGFLLSLFSGEGGSGGGRGTQYTFGTGDQLSPPEVMAIVSFVLVFALAFFVLGIVLRNLSRGALIGMVREAEEMGDTNVGSGWRTGWSRFLPLLGIDLVIGIPAAIMALVLIAIGLAPLVLLVAKERALSLLAIVLTVFLMLLMIGLLIAMGLVLSVLGKLARRQCVLEKKGVWDSIRDGYGMGRENLRHVGLVRLLLLGIGLLFAVAIVPLSVAVFGVAAAPAAAVYAATEAVLPSILVGILIGLPGVLLLALLGGIYEAFRSAVWTLTYLELQV